MSNKPVWALGYALRQAKVACAEEIAMMLCRGKAHVHVAGDLVEENRVEATPTAEGSYDTVVYCVGCGEELSRTTTTIPMLKLNGYLYNGVLLPDFEAWMKRDTWYFVWLMDGGGGVTLVVMEKPLPAYVWYNGNNDPGHKMMNTTSTSVVYSKLWGVRDGVMSFPSSYKNYDYTVKSGSSIPFYSHNISPDLIFWANYDVYEAVKSGDKWVQTNTILFPKSPDPIPVYE